MFNHGSKPLPHPKILNLKRNCIIPHQLNKQLKENTGHLLYYLALTFSRPNLRYLSKLPYIAITERVPTNTPRILLYTQPPLTLATAIPPSLKHRLSYYQSLI
jgi:hypothetical protein